MKRITIFASGSGTNFQRIAEYFKLNKDIEISILVCNKPEAGAIKRAQNLAVPVTIIDRNTFYNSTIITDQLLDLRIDLIVLAGFLWLVPEHLLKAFPHRIINIHPALLPAYGGKGMYGEKVHEAVIANKEKYSGITIHYVNEHYDEGDIIFQEKFIINQDETASTLADRIHTLEHQFYPEIISQLLNL